MNNPLDFNRDAWNANAQIWDNWGGKFSKIPPVVPLRLHLPDT
jgi:hypothetical protein